jgi:hypothetical protein
LLPFAVCSHPREVTKAKLLFCAAFKQFFNAHKHNAILLETPFSLFVIKHRRTCAARTIVGAYNIILVVNVRNVQLSVRPFGTPLVEFFAFG